MNRARNAGRGLGKASVASFTLVELLMVMAIIALLAGLILAASLAVMTKASRSRASAEIQAMGAAAEGYKSDNGIYPQGMVNLTTNAYVTTDATVAGGEYQVNSGLLYYALSGQTNFVTPPVAGTKVYMTFKANQVGNPSAAYSYIQDPWRISYGYSTGTALAAPGGTNYPYAGNGFYDLWSTANTTVFSPNTNAWLSSWTQ